MAKRPRPRLVRLKPPAGDTQMADTLLFLLERVRLGRVKAFSVCLVVERPDGVLHTLETSGADGDDFFEIQLLGAMRGAEHGLMERRARRRAL